MLELKSLSVTEYDYFIKMNQDAFRVAAEVEFGPQEEEIISREDIIQSLEEPNAEAFSIIYEGKTVGGIVVQIDKTTQHNSLDLLFVDPEKHSAGIGTKVWNMIEKMYPETVLWETHTPYFEVRNIHFYVNKCGFHIVEFYNPQHPEPEVVDTPGGDLFFRFEKHMKWE